MRERVSRFAYLFLSALFALGLLTQVSLVGLSLLGGRSSWEEHITLGHTLMGPLLFMLVLAYVGRMPGPVKPLTWAVFGVYLVLADFVIFLRDSAPLVAALHPVLAVVLFALAVHLPMRAWRIVNGQLERIEETSAESELPGGSTSRRVA